MDASTEAYDSEQRIWSGPEYKSQYDLNCSIGKIIYNYLKTNPEQVCEIHDGGEVFTKSSVLTSAIRLAQHFKKIGLTHEDVVGISAKNSTYVLSLCVACFMNCTPFNAVHPNLDDARHLFGITKPKIIFCDGENYAKMSKATKDLNAPIYTMTEHLPDVPRVELLLEPTGTERSYEPEGLTLGGDQTMAILCSSGTTGLPKAVCISNQLLSKHSADYSNDDLILGFTGIDWMTGLIMALMTLLQGCRRLVPSKPFSPEYYVELVKKYKPNFSFLSPISSVAVANCPTATPANLASLRVFCVGGGAMNLSTLENIQAKLLNGVLAHGYGTTEAFRIAAGILYGKSVGRVLFGNRVRIVDDSGNNLGPNEVGEVLIDNGTKWLGYYGNPAETKLIQVDPCWLRTGDMGYFDDDQYLYLVDRKKDTLKCYGEHYWPSEIESVIQELPGVRDACVVGIFSELYGDAPGAIVVKDNDCQLTAEDIKQHVVKRMPMVHKHLHAGVLFVEKLPRNVNGKVIKGQAKEMFLKEIETMDNGIKITV